MKVRLTRKLAERLDGVDLRGHDVGEAFEVTAKDASLLVAEKWAMHERRNSTVPGDQHRRSEDRDDPSHHSR